MHGYYCSTHLLEQVVVDVAAYRVALEVEVDVHVLAEATRVVVTVRLRVSERLQDAVRLQQDVLHSTSRKLDTLHKQLSVVSCGRYHCKERKFCRRNYFA